MLNNCQPIINNYLQIYKFYRLAIKTNTMLELW